MRAGASGVKYYVSIGAVTHEVTIDGDAVDFDGTPVRASIENLAGTPVQLLRIGGETHRIIARRGEVMGRYDLSIDGHRITVDALDERTRAIRALSGASGRAARPTHLMAPMPGLIVRVNVKEGDAVRPGQGLVVMEAMKMENELRAAGAGTVRRVLVSPGSAVEKGVMLLEME